MHTFCLPKEKYIMHSRRISVLFIIGLMILVPFALMAQEEESEGESGTAETTAEADTPDDGVEFGVGLETVQLDGQTWTRLHLFPVLPFGKLQLALDLELFFNEEGEVSSRGWDFSSTDATLDSLSRKIYFVAWNQKRNVTAGDDIFYGRLGALDGVTIGDGIIMNNYRNTLDYPVIKKTGLDFAIGNLTGLNIGMEGMIGDFTDLSRGGPVVGGRAFFSPLAPSGIPILENLQFGVSGVMDVNQYGGLRDSDDDSYPDLVDRFPDDSEFYADLDGDGTPDATDPDIDGDGVPDFDGLDSGDQATLESILGADNVEFDVPGESVFSLEGKQDSFAMVGADMRLPITSFLSIYGQAATSVDPDEGDDANRAQGFGIAAPGVRLDFLPILSADLGYRYRSGEFRFGYFNENYDNERAAVDEDGNVFTKDSTLTDGTLNGVYGSLNANLYIINVYGSYEYLIPISGGDESISLEARAGLNRERLAQIPVLSNYLNGLNAYFAHENVTSNADLFDMNPAVIMGARAEIGLGESTTLIYDFQRTFDANGDPVDKMSIGTQTSF
jgi:hypothetical protein